MSRWIFTHVFWISAFWGETAAAARCPVGILDTGGGGKLFEFRLRQRFGEAGEFPLIHPSEKKCATVSVMDRNGETWASLESPLGRVEALLGKAGPPSLSRGWDWRQVDSWFAGLNAVPPKAEPLNPPQRSWFERNRTWLFVGAIFAGAAVFRWGLQRNQEGGPALTVAFP